MFIKACIAMLSSDIYDEVQLNIGIDYSGYFRYNKKYLCVYEEANLIRVYDENTRWVNFKINSDDERCGICFNDVFTIVEDGIKIENDNELSRLADKINSDENYKIMCRWFIDEYNKLAEQYQFKENHEYTVKKLIPISLAHLFKL